MPWLIGPRTWQLKWESLLGESPPRVKLQLSEEAPKIKHLCWVVWCLKLNEQWWNISGNAVKQTAIAGRNSGNVLSGTMNYISLSRSVTEKSGFIWYVPFCFVSNKNVEYCFILWNWTDENFKHIITWERLVGWRCHFKINSKSELLTATKCRSTYVRVPPSAFSDSTLWKEENFLVPISAYRITVGTSVLLAPGYVWSFLYRFGLGLQAVENAV